VGEKGSLAGTFESFEEVVDDIGYWWIDFLNGGPELVAHVFQDHERDAQRG
jgi:hypothetical protein